MKSIIKNGHLLILLLIAGLNGSAQKAPAPIIIEPRLHIGMNIPFYKALDYLVEDDIYAFDLNISFPTYGKDYWEKLYRYPRPGMGYSFWSLGNNDVFGKAHAIFGYINVPIYKKTEKFSVNYQVSLGGAYITKPFDKDNNPLNRAIGSHGNIYVRLGIDSKIRLFTGCELVVEAGITHFSNGKTCSPNYGINAGSFSFGLNYLFNYDGAIFSDPGNPEINKRFIQSVIYSAGSKVYDNLLGKKYFTTSVSYNIERFINHKMRIGLGGDFFYDGSIKEALASDDGVTEDEFVKLIRVGMHASYAIQYKKVILGVQLGHYLYSKCVILTSFYNKISVQYLFYDHLLGSVAVKSHLGKADCLEYGIGYYW
jgi:hypothetical protein